MRQRKAISELQTLLKNQTRNEETLTKYEGMIERLQNQILVTMTENDKNKKLLQTKSENIRSLQNENETNQNRLNEATQVQTIYCLIYFDLHFLK